MTFAPCGDATAALEKKIVARMKAAGAGGRLYGTPQGTVIAYRSHDSKRFETTIKFDRNKKSYVHIIPDSSLGKTGWGRTATDAIDEIESQIIGQITSGEIQL